MAVGVVVVVVEVVGDVVAVVPVEPVVAVVAPEFPVVVVVDGAVVDVAVEAVEEVVVVDA